MELITVREAALLRNVTTSAIYDLIAKGRIHSYSQYGRILVEKRELVEFVKNKSGPKKLT